LYSKIIRYIKSSTPYQEESKKALYLVGVSHLWLGQYEDAKHVNLYDKKPLIV